MQDYSEGAEYAERGREQIEIAEESRLKELVMSTDAEEQAMNESGPLACDEQSQEQEYDEVEHMGLEAWT